MEKVIYGDWLDFIQALTIHPQDREKKAKIINLKW